MSVLNICWYDPAWRVSSSCYVFPHGHQHEHDPSSELSKQSLLLSESDYDTIDGSPKSRPHIPSPLVSSSLAPESPPGYVWYVKFVPLNWKMVWLADI